MSIKENRNARIAGGAAIAAILLAVGAGIGSSNSAAEPAPQVAPSTTTVTETVTQKVKAQPATVTKTKTVTKTNVKTKTKTVTNAPVEPLYEDPPADAYYENCDAARAAGAAPVYAGGPGYGGHLDRDGDGVGCE